MVDVEVNNTSTVDVLDSIDANITTNVVPTVDATNDLQIEINRKEYSIVGDELYIPKRYEEAPQWLRDLIDTVVGTAIDLKVQDLNTLDGIFNTLIAELEVAKNTYTQSIISSNDIDERINTAITTLNSTLADADSTILNVALARTTPDEVNTLVTTILAASIAGGDIAAAVNSLQSAIATVDGARALDYTALESAIAGEAEATATALQTLNTYVGTDVAGADYDLSLSAYLKDPSTGVVGGADSKVANLVEVDNLGNATSKFEYSSLLNKNGVYYKSGFGLSTLATGGTGTAVDPYDSEFWINAAKFKFTNDNVTGQVAPFTIDASGTQPEITFNGKVSFTNVTDYTPPDISGDIASNNDIFAQKLGYANYAAMVNAAASGQTIVSGGYINTGLIEANAITANQINTAGLVADSVAAENISGTTITGKLIYGSTLQASYLDFNDGFKLLTSYSIPISTYNANPSLYSDAVLRDGYTTYRIPTLSKVSEVLKSATLGYNQSIYGTLHSYNTANTGDFLKARLIRPMVATVSSDRMVSSEAYEPFPYATESSFATNRKIDFAMYYGSTLILQVALVGGLFKDTGTSPYIQVTCPYGTSVNVTPSTILGSSSSNGDNTYYTKTIIDTGIFKFDAEFRITTWTNQGELVTYTTRGSAAYLDLKANSAYMPFNWTSGTLSVKNLRSNCTVTAKISDGIYIDNMQ